jgi:hypothetical protein
MMHSPLHARASYLDPRLFGMERHQDEEVTSGLYEAIEMINWIHLLQLWLDPSCRAYRLQEEYLEPKQ